MSESELRLTEFQNWHQHFEWRYVLGNHTPCRVLDYGCGYGYGAIYLGLNGFVVDGYDIDLERLEIARYILSKQPWDVKDRVRFLDRLPSEEYDLVWISHALEHIPVSEWMAIFNSLPKCKMLVSVPLRDAYDNPSHVNHWDEAGFLQDITRLSGLTWRVWTDEEHHVIKAVTT